MSYAIYIEIALLRFELSVRKASVTNGLGAGTSLPPWQQISDAGLTKAITEPKSRGTSFGTTLSAEVLFHCISMIHVLVIQCFGYCVYAHLSVLNMKCATKKLNFALV